MKTSKLQNNMMKVCFSLSILLSGSALSGNNLDDNKTSISINKPLQDIPLVDSTLSLNVAFGSGAFHSISDPENVFYTITDRGPVISCHSSKKFFGKKKLCTSKKGNKGEKGKIFLTPDSSPTIYKMALNNDGIDILETIPLRDSNGNRISGITNPLRSSSTEKAYTRQGVRIPYDASGLDPEALVRLNDGTFWIAEEYAPSLVHISSNGNIINRVVPRTVATDLSIAAYPVHTGLPKILRKRPLNRGIEALAISHDETQLYFMMQSPLANPKESTSRKSKNIRIIRYALDADGNLGNLTGEFVYRLDKRKTFIFENDKPSKGTIYITDMAALDSNKLLVVERTKHVTKIYKINLISATNIVDTNLDRNASPSLEKTKKLKKLEINPVNKELVYSSLDDTSTNPVSGKIEGLAVLDQTHILLINDNDFGIDNQQTHVRIITTENTLF